MAGSAAVSSLFNLAERAVSFLCNQLILLFQQEGVENNIRDELGNMRAFLQAADQKEESDPQLKEGVKQVREITYDIEDLLDRYMLELAHLHLDADDADGWKRYSKKMYALVKKLMLRHQIASEFQEIKLRIENASKSQQILKGIYDFKDQGSSSQTYDIRDDALLLEEADLVGIEKPKKQLVERLKQTDHDGLMVISVVGMGGLGKTTLVKKIYDDASVKDKFDSHVWVNVSENFHFEGVLRNMIKQLVDEVKQQRPQFLELMNGHEMKQYINNFLKNRTYMIVLDDVWKIDVWESIKYAFPRTSACIIIMTTRLCDIGNAACRETCGHLYKLKPLTAENSRKLFHRKAFPGNSCPSDLNEISESILKRCEGLPLAIVVIGGLLATKNNNLEDWEMFERTIGHELQGDDFHIKTMNKLLSLSYYDLPHHLKTCFLYLSIFPEDELLSKGKVIRLWIAEGFVEAKDGKTLEDVAETYLNELLNRSLIQVADSYVNGKPRKFRIHDILREFIISKSKEQNLLVVACGEEMKCSDKIRLMVINTKFNDAKESYNVKHLRSLFWLDFADIESGPILQNVLGHCRLLKVLDLRRAPIDSIPNEAFELYLLKYLCLKYTDIKVIPESIGNLRDLETLDIRHAKVTKLPVEILKLRKLRYLLVYTYKLDALTMKAPYRIGSHLTSLRSLYRIDADKAGDIKIVREIGKLTQLRRLGITKLRREDGRDLCSSLAKLTKLRSLHISNEKTTEDGAMDLDHSLPSSTLTSLRTIYIKGPLVKFPQWVCSLSGLTRLELFRNRLKEDPSQHIGALPNLVWLSMARFSYVGKELIFGDGKFQKLKELIIRQLRGLRGVRVEKGSMPHLERLRLWDCNLMEELPEGIEHLNNLQLVEFRDMSEKFKRDVSEKFTRGPLVNVRVTSDKLRGDSWDMAEMGDMFEKLGDMLEKFQGDLRRMKLAHVSKVKMGNDLSEPSTSRVPKKKGFKTMSRTTVYMREKRCLVPEKEPVANKRKISHKDEASVQSDKFKKVEGEKKKIKGKGKQNEEQPDDESKKVEAEKKKMKGKGKIKQS